ncbi:hypothetical protein AN189_18000 [Loktanella sp. 3ANDIMAR09]|nr:hypothetical protein AN189_18000 [Loktanella sp. 3ANDIMAR09]
MMRAAGVLSLIVCPWIRGCRGLRSLTVRCCGRDARHSDNSGAGSSSVQAIRPAGFFDFADLMGDARRV